MTSNRWRVNREGPEWLMDQQCRLIGYRDLRGNEYYAPFGLQADGIRDIDEPDGADRAASATIPALASMYWSTAAETTLQQAIDQASASGKGSVRPLPGVYILTEQLRLKSNVTLDLSGGVRLVRGFNVSPLGGSLIGMVDCENVTIIGGILDGNGNVFDNSFDILWAVRTKNLTIKGTKFLNVVDYHAIDLAGCKTVRIKRCHFLGFWNKSNAREFSEAIQMDPGADYGGLFNEDVEVDGCLFAGPENTALTSFTTWPCAMGNHSAWDGLWHKGIVFTRNTVIGATWAGVNLLNMDDARVSLNHFDGADTLHGVRLRLNDTVAPAEGCNNVVISDNIFTIGGGASVKFASPTTANIGNIGAGRHKDVSITGNISKAGYALAQVCFASGGVIVGNEHTGGTYGVDIRFSDGVEIGPNLISDVSQTAYWVNESTETALAGQGLTADISISGGTARRCGYRAVHFNCAVLRGKVQGVQIIDPSAASPTREAIRGDSGAVDLSVIGNTIRFSGAQNATFGISLSASCVNAAVKGNVSAGATGLYQLQAPGALVDIEGNGSPEGVVSARVGSRYMRLDGSAGSINYFKTSGTGNTGWTANG